MGVTTTFTNKPINPRGNDASPLGYNRAALYSGKALDFDGVNDLLTISDGINSLVGGEITLTAWVRLDAVSGYPCIISNKVNDTNGFAFLVNPTGNQLFWQYDGAAYQIESGGELTLGELYFVCATYDGSNLKTYINGVESVTKAAPSKGLTATGDLDLYIGRQNTATGYWNGLISGLRAFNTALTAAQVADLYNNPEKIVPTGVSNDALKLWLPMMEGAGTTAYDGSGNGNHGTISGATWTHGIGSPVAQTAVIDWNKKENLIIRSESIVENQVPGGWGQNSGAPLESSSEADPTGRNTASLINVASQSASEFFYNYQTPVTSGETYTFSIWTKLGTADNVVFVLNDTVSWNSITGANYVATAANGYDEWKQVSITFTAPASNKINAHIGYHQETGVAAQDNGTFYIWGAALHKGSTPVLVPTFGTAQSSEVLLPQGLTSGRDITGVNLFENVRKQGALNLDGNSWAEVHDNASLDITDAITLEAWVYWVDTRDQTGIMGRWGANTALDRNYMLYVENSTSVRLYINTAFAEYTSMTTGWRHIVGTYDKANMRLYVDGTQVAVAAQTSDITTSAKVLEIGRYRYATDVEKEYTNDIAQPRIYNRALTAAEVLQNYNSGKSIYTNS